jgi:hypothetical protein
MSALAAALDWIDDHRVHVAAGVFAWTVACPGRRGNESREYHARVVTAERKAKQRG